MLRLLTQDFIILNHGRLAKSGCEEAGIPIDEREFKTNSTLALAIIKIQLDKFVTIDYIEADGLYGNNIAFA